MTSKNVVFDIVGTLIGYDKITDAIEKTMGDKLRKEGVKPSFVTYAWIEVAEREYTYLSMSGRYAKFSSVFEQVFYRILYGAGISNPREISNIQDLEYIMKEYAQLEARPGAAECVTKLREAGFTVWALTAADINRVNQYFASSGIKMPAENLVSCDTKGIGKPDPRAYQSVFEQLKELGQPWFAAGHAWDVSSARLVGFKGAYCTVYEKEYLPEVFGEMDIVADTLPEMADKIIATSS